MQTPGDPFNWVKTCDAYIGKKYSDEELNQSVDLYLQRCHEVGLQVIGVTDHNFIGKEYLKRLIERNSIVAKELNKEPIVIFPGFEVEISQGLGVHVLCLFETDTPLEVIDDMVTELGLPKRSRVIENSITPLNKDFDSLVSFIQDHKDFPGIVIAAHPLAESGMLHDRFMSDHFQRGMFKDKRLLAMEIPKPVEMLAKGIQKIILSSDNCHEQWKREKSIATIMSSDCYSLVESEKGFIGKRHSWILFSKPSINSLRQAFNDHSSRIKLQKDSPDNEFRFGRIRSLEIENVAFLENQYIKLAPNLNCIIGGRGSGKSSILEYIRLCTNSLTNFDEQLLRIKNTLQEDSTLKLTYQDSNGLTDIFKFSGEEVSIPTRDEIKDSQVILNTLGINIYSQREITQMGQDSPSLMPLINKISGNDLKIELHEETDITEKIISLIQVEVKFERLKREKIQLEQELEELKRQWDKFTSIKEFNDKKKRVTSSKEFISNVKKDKDEIVSRLTEAMGEITTLYERYENISLEKQVIKPEYLSYIKEEFTKVLLEVNKELEKSKENLHKNISESNDNHMEWASLNIEFDKSEKEFEEACRTHV